MARAWYILQTYSQYEIKVERAIRQLMEEGELQDRVFDVKIPTEKVHETKNGKRIEKDVRIWPGYVLVEMDISGADWKNTVSPIKRIQGVSGFVGAVGNVKPSPMKTEEVKAIMMRSGEIKADRTVLFQQTFKEGEEVKIVDGPFDSFTGSIEEVYADKQKLRVVVGIFGRATPVEVDFNQVERV